MLSYGGGCDCTVLVMVNKAWNTFRELKSFLCAKRMSLNAKWQVYAACVRSCMMRGGETLAISMDNMTKLYRTEIKMLWMMCADILQDTISNADLRNRFGIDCIGDFKTRSRLHWFEHV